MKNKTYHSVGTILKSNIKIGERGTIDIANTNIKKKEKISHHQISSIIQSENCRNRREIDTSNMHVHNHSLSWFGATTIIGVKTRLK